MTELTVKPRKPTTKQSKFVILTDEELKEKEEKLDNANTLKRECSAHITFDKFLEQAGVQSRDYWLYSDEDLCQWLRKFWFGVCRENGDYIKINTLR